MKSQLPTSNIQINLKSQIPTIGFWKLAVGIYFVVVVLMLGSAGYAADRVKIIKVETKRMGAYDEVHVYTSENIKPEVILLESPNRVALVFANSQIDAPLTLAGPSPLIRIIQAAQFDENTVYVIVEPNEKLSYEYAYIIGHNKFILEFTKARPGAKRTVEPSTPEAAVAEIPVTPEAVAASPEVEAPPVIKPVTKKIAAPPKAKKPAKKAKKVVISKAPPPLRGRTIVIDPGHGGRDPGYVGRSGIFEKFLNLKIALKLEKLLKDGGAKVIMTRRKDVSTKDKTIVDLANRNRADLFVAIHLNSYSSPRVGGCETFYFTPQSRKFAQVMQKNLSRTIKLRNRGVKKNTYYTVHHTKMPAVLVEAAYLTNPREEKLVLNPAFQARIALGMYKGISEYVKMSSWQRSPR
jgi:N-acetylmuramoyl-L-alanine amidase